MDTRIGASSEPCARAVPSQGFELVRRRLGSVHLLYMILTLTLAGFLVLALAWATFRDIRVAYIAFFAFQSLLSLLLHNLWFYVWDPLGMIFFTLFTFFVLTRRRTGDFALLFAVAILNREERPVLRRLDAASAGGRVMLGTPAARGAAPFRRSPVCDGRSLLRTRYFRRPHHAGGPADP